jgi:CHAT domain-containing protein
MQKINPLALIVISAIIVILGSNSASADDLDALNAKVFSFYRKGLHAEAALGAERYRDLARTRYRAPSRKYANGLSNLAMVYAVQGRFSEAETVARELVDLERQLTSENSPSYAEALTRLAWLYGHLGRYAESEPLYIRSLEIVSARFGATSGQAGEALSNIAGNYHDLGQLALAEETYRKTLEILIKARGRNHLIVAQTLHNLAGVFPDSRVDEKLALLSECVRILRTKRNVPPEVMGFALGSLGAAHKAKGDLVTAEKLLIKAVALIQKTQGATHRITAGAVGHLAQVYQRQGDFARAYSLFGDATAAAIERTRQGVLHSKTETQMAFGRESARAGGTFLSQASVGFELARNNPQLADNLKSEGFALSQWAQFSQAGNAITQMAQRLSAGTDDLALAIRTRQDWTAKRNTLNNRMIALVGQSTSSKAELAELRRDLAAADQAIAAEDHKIARDHTNFSNWSSQEPVGMAEVAQTLRDDEILVQTGFDDEGLLWLVSKARTDWVRVPFSAEKITEYVRGLRCGLDSEEWSTPTKAKRCADLVGLKSKIDPSQPLPFDLGKAHELYQALFGQIEDMIAGKRLLIVPSGPLTSLPFQVLVTKKPETALPSDFAGYRDVAWLGRSHAISVLPAVSSLKALRERAARGEQASLDYAGFGNPVLAGGKDCKSIKVPEACPAVKSPEAIKLAALDDGVASISGGQARRNSASMNEVFAQGAAPEAVVSRVRALCPLPDTAYEIRCVSERFKKDATLIRLDKSATKTDIMELNASGALARYRILHFATHGLLAGDVAEIAKKQGEPALVLTPPEAPNKDGGDTGLLLASDVAQLKLNADWVVLSACNTAAGEELGAEALSGLARAFFYAGSKSLLVSHWPVYSQAAVRLTTRAFAVLDENPQAGRADAFRTAMVELMDDYKTETTEERESSSKVRNAHPAIWAPFSAVGDGGR